MSFAEPSGSAVAFPPARPGPGLLRSGLPCKVTYKFLIMQYFYDVFQQPFQGAFLAMY